jgi:uncharacterized DUF497 family protein
MLVQKAGTFKHEGHKGKTFGFYSYYFVSFVFKPFGFGLSELGVGNQFIRGQLPPRTHSSKPTTRRRDKSTQSEATPICAPANKMGYTLSMKFAWDPQKASSNLRKHGISFDEAVTVFKDPLAYIFDDMKHSEQEHREIIIGMSALRRMLLVCFVERQEDIVRLISARPATRIEINDYEENTRNQTP